VKSQIRGHLVAEALSSLRPLSQYAVGSDGSINWIDTVQTQPTQSQIDAEIIRLALVYNAQEYQRLRQYPSLGDQLDMLWHAIDNGTLNKTSDFYTAIKAVKDAHPKE
jgi:hypothetical protein